MYIRKTVSKSKKDQNQKYYTYRLVESVRIGKKVKQNTLLNLGADFSVDQSLWSDLSKRIEDIIKGQSSLFSLDAKTESLAQQYALQILSSRSKKVEEESDSDILYEAVNLDTMTHSNVKTVGVEHLLYEMMRELKLDEKLDTLDLTPMQFNAALGVIIAKATAPDSEAASLKWLQDHSAAGELFDADYTKMSLSTFYRISDRLLAHKKELEDFLYQGQKELFGFEETITLYDLTNTYFEGSATGVDKAARGRSKEKRTDAPLITLALVLDGSGFVKRSEIFKGNISEPKTLQQMIKALTKKESETNILDVAKKPLIAMDAGIASEENLTWLKEHGYEYIAVSRKHEKQFDESKAVVVKQKKDDVIVRVQKVINEASDEIELYCHSVPREAKEEAMQKQVQTRFEEELAYLKEGLGIKRRTKKYTKVIEKVGRLKERYKAISGYYTIEVTKDPKSGNAIELIYKEKKDINNKSAMNGIYCLRTNNKQLDEATLWRTYTSLTDLEAVFRSLKSELGLRPVYHQKQSRVDGHIFITLLAYSIIHSIRYRLKSKGIHYSWDSIRKVMSSQVRITTTLQCKDGRTVHIRKSSQLNEKQQVLMDAMSFKHTAGEVTKVYI